MLKPALITFVILGYVVSSNLYAEPCSLIPIAVSNESILGLTPGEPIPDIFNGDGPGNFGWLTWTGSPSTPALVQSLNLPGNSNLYVNPDDTSDYQVSIGDWVQGKPGVSNAKKVRDALDLLIGDVVTVSVWNEVRGQGNNIDYRVYAFVNIQITDYFLPGNNQISAIFHGFASCNDGNTAPVITAGDDETILLGENFNFNGSGTDDGLPAPGILDYEWSQVSGPADAIIVEPTALDSEVQFPVEGIYTFQLTATDQLLVSTDTIVITVSNQTPHPLLCLKL